MDTSSMSPADFAAMSGNELGNNGFFYMMFLFFVLFGYNGFGGYGGNNQYATNESVRQGFDMQNTLANQRELLAATNQSFHDTMGVINNTYSEIQRDIAGLAVGQANLLAQQNECCASMGAAIAQNRYEAAMNTAQVVQAVQAEGAATRQMLQQNRYDDLLQKYNALDQRVNTQEIQSTISAATANVVRYPNGFMYSAGPSPFCGCPNGMYNM